jgi:hypothetical protein
MARRGLGFLVLLCLRNILYRAGYAPEVAT